MLSVSVASDVVFSSNVSLGEELDSDDLQADNSPKETHRRKIIIAVKSRYFLSLDLVNRTHNKLIVAYFNIVKKLQCV